MMVQFYIISINKKSRYTHTQMCVNSRVTYIAWQATNVEKARLGVKAEVDKAKLAELMMLALQRLESDLREVLEEIDEDAPENVNESDYMLNDLDDRFQKYRSDRLSELLDKVVTVKNTATDVTATLTELEVFFKSFASLAIEVSPRESLCLCHRSNSHAL